MTEETGAFVQLPLEEGGDGGPLHTEHTGLVTAVTWVPRFFSYFLELTICNRLNTPLPSALGASRSQRVGGTHSSFMRDSNAGSKCEFIPFLSLLRALHNRLNY